MSLTIYVENHVKVLDETRYVFNTCLKACCDKSGDRQAVSQLFQLVSPLLVKLCCTVAVKHAEEAAFQLLHIADAVDMR